MKAIIFDLDNTLIMWKDEFILALKKVIKDMNLNYDEKLINKIDSAINESEKHFKKLTKQNLLDFINKTCNINLPMEFINKLEIEQGNLYYEDKDVVSTIEYLSKKYDLYVVTNWFTKTQSLRLEGMGILKYFKKVYGADINYYKPQKCVFDCILNNYKPSECISIGDSLENDVKLPISLGMNAIWKTNEINNNYKTIKDIKDLMNIL